MGITAIESTLKVIEELAKADPRGARWDRVIEALEKQGLKRNEIDDAALELLDNGQVTEEEIGRLKPKKSGLFNW